MPKLRRWQSTLRIALSSSGIEIAPSARIKLARGEIVDENPPLDGDPDLEDGPLTTRDRFDSDGTPSLAFPDGL